MCVGAYRRCVVSKCLQVSDVGVNEPSSALDLVADIMVCCIGNEYSQTETHTRTHTSVTSSITMTTVPQQRAA